MDIAVRQETVGNDTRRTMLLTGIEGYKEKEIEIFWDMVNEPDLPFPRVFDGFVNGIIFFAMRLGQHVHVNGPLSCQYLRNIHEFQDAWALWLPEKYQRVDVTADQIIDGEDTSPRDSALAAYSGGVDSVFTLLRHATGLLREASYPLNKAVMLVHGFDIPLDKSNHLGELIKRIKPLTDQYMLTIKVVRTNSKESNLQDWQDSFMSQLSSCLHQFSHDFKYGLVGSSEPYNALVLPWGSSPVTDHHLSGVDLMMIHDGAAFSRVSKVEEISKHPRASEVLKVCWEGLNAFENCGKCEKCIRTILNYYAVGVDVPPCFSNVLDCRDIQSVNIMNDAQYNEFETILVYAKKHGRKGEWVDALEQLLTKGVNPPSLIKKLRKKLDKALQLIHSGNYSDFLKKIKRDIGTIVVRKGL